MSNRISAHLRSNVVGYIALFCFAMGGTAYATHPGGANTISTGDIINDQVFTQDIADNNMTSQDVRNDTLGSGGLQAIDLRADSVGSSEVATGAVGNDELADDAVGSAEIIPDTIQQVDLANDVIASGEVVDDSLTGTDISSAFGRDSAVFVTIPGDATPVELTNVTVTPSSTGTLLARAVGYCNIHPEDADLTPGDLFQVQIGIGPDLASSLGFDFQNHGFIQTIAGDEGPQQHNYVAEELFPGTAGVPTTLVVGAYDAFGNTVGGESDCSAALTVQELTGTALEPASASSGAAGPATGTGG